MAKTVVNMKMHFHQHVPSSLPVNVYQCVQGKPTCKNEIKIFRHPHLSDYIIWYEFTAFSRVPKTKIQCGAMPDFFDVVAWVVPDMRTINRENHGIANNDG